MAVALALSLGLVTLTGNGEPNTANAAAPDITLTYFDGSTETLSELKGRPVVLNFWASWCPACITEMPSFADVHRRYRDQVEFVGINMQEVSLDAALSLVERTGVEYRLAHDPDGAVFNAFGGLAMPTTVFVDSDGAVVRVHSGTIFSDDLVAVIEEDLLG
ncbi:MAG: TlpA family protein disulfide reductase [Acidimicrobiia bacterium]